MLAHTQHFSLRYKIGFLLLHVRRIAPWPVAGGVFIAVLWLCAMLIYQHEIGEIQHTAIKAASAQARTVGNQIERTIAQLDYTLLSLQFQWQEKGGGLNLEQQLAAGLVPKNIEISISVFDRHGLPVTTTSPGVRGTKGIASRDYFQAHAASPSKDLLISKPVRSILIGRDIIALSRRLNAADGTFAGVIVAAIEPAFLTSFVDETKLGKDDFAAIRSAEGDLYAFKTESGVGSDRRYFISNTPVENPHGVRRSSDQYADKQARIVSWYTTSTYPITAVVGLSEATLQAVMSQGAGKSI